MCNFTRKTDAGNKKKAQRVKDKKNTCSLIESDEGPTSSIKRHAVNITGKQRIKAGTDHLYCDIY